jgi:6-phosphofructokinase
MIKIIGILTGGGDCLGIDEAIRTIVWSGTRQGYVI